MPCIAKKDVQPKSSTDDTVDITVVGWKGATYFTEGIIGPKFNKDNNVSSWDCTDKEYVPWKSGDSEEAKNLETSAPQFGAGVQ